MKYYSEFGDSIRGRRQAAGLTQEELAERCGMSARQISNIESGNTIPKLDTVLKLCAACGIDAGELQQLAGGVVGDIEAYG